jgi:hypothetical protein
MSTQTLVGTSSTTPAKSTNVPANPTCDTPSKTNTLAQLAKATSDARYETSARRVELWSPWGERERPSTAAEEAAFVARLRELSADCAPAAGEVTHRRYDITAVVTSLRNAVTADEMLRSAPGLRPQAVLAAYDYLEACRTSAARAWQALVAEPTAATFADVNAEAGLLLPVAISRLRALLSRQPEDTVVFARTVAQIDREIQATLARAEQLEGMLTGSAGPAAAAQAAELLNDAWGEGTWSLATFLAPRVGTLVSVRLSSLLGEDRTEPGRRSGVASNAATARKDVNAAA